MIGCALFFYLFILIGECALFLSVHIIFSLFVLVLDFFFDQIFECQCTACSAPNI